MDQHWQVKLIAECATKIYCAVYGSKESTADDLKIEIERCVVLAHRIFIGSAHFLKPTKK